MSNPTPRFDISCINMFRIIDSLRVKLQPFVSEMLQSFSGLPSSWIKSGRLCVPQLLFTFDAHEGFEYINNNNVHLYVKHLEEQIYRVLRKSRLISNVNLNSLFTISSSNTFVYISTKNPTISDYSSYLFQHLSNRCNNRDILICESSQTLNNNNSFLNFLLPHFNIILNDASGKPNFHNNLTKASVFFKILIVFKELIFEQLYLGISSEKSKNLQKIFDSLYSTLDIDNKFSEVRCSKMVTNAFNFYQENLPAHYTLETHERKLMLTLQHFTMQTRGPLMYKYIQIIQSDCEKFWNNGRKMCEERSFTGNNCIHKVHRVPQDDYSDQAIEANSNISENLPVMTHKNLVKIISACDCGRRQGNREDPFTVKAANYDFYLKMKFKCHTCRNITRIKFLVCDANLDFEKFSSSQNLTSKSENRDSPLIKSYSDADTSSSSSDQDEEICNKNFEDDDIQQDVLSIDNFGEMMSLNNDDNFVQTYGDLDLSNHENNGDKSDSSHQNDGSNEAKSDDSQKEVSKKSNLSSNEKSDELKNESFDDKSTQISENDEFGDKEFLSEEEFFCESETSKVVASVDIKSLPPMIHTLCPENTPARFSSWSLVCLGSSSIYSHNIGIQDQQGFINGSHFLLPWNVTVMLQHSRNMPPLWEGKRPPGIKHKKTLKGTRDL